MERLKALLKQRLSATLSRFGGAVGRRIIDRDAPLDRKLLAELANTQSIFSFRDAEILQYGLVRLQRHYCLDLDYGAKAALGSWKCSGRQIPKAVALWSHPWMGYYHWIVDVLPKLCLMQQQLGMDLGGATLCYPRWLPAIEDESLQMLGLGGNPIIDTAREGGVSADTVYASRLPGWYQIHTGASLLRDRLISFAGSGRGNRIYVSRAGRRRIFNEEEVRQCLESRGFTIIEDQPRSLREQISLFREAEVVVAPHGAALANILWCRPRALVLELANESYYPPFYKNLADFCGLRNESILAPGGRSHWTKMGDSITVSLVNLQKKLDREGIVAGNSSW
jgi:hypothetical protein